MYQIAIFSKLFAHPWTGYLGNLEFQSVRLTSARIASASSFWRFFTASSIAAMISLLGYLLEVTEKLRPFARRSVSIWVICLEGKNITSFFLSAILVVLCVTLFLLINSLNFRICLFFVNSKEFHKSFRQDGTPQVLEVLQSHLLIVRCCSWAYHVYHDWHVSALTTTVY